MATLSGRAFSSAFQAPRPPAPPRRADQGEAPEPGIAGQPRHRDAGPWPVQAYAIVAIPLGLLAVLALVVPAYVTPLSDDRVSLLGLPGGYVLIGVAALLGVIGAAAVRFVRHRLVVAVILMLTTVLGLTIVTLVPALITVLINLKT